MAETEAQRIERLRARRDELNRQGRPAPKWEPQALDGAPEPPQWEPPALDGAPDAMWEAPRRTYSPPGAYEPQTAPQRPAAAAPQPAPQRPAAQVDAPHPDIASVAWDASGNALPNQPRPVPVTPPDSGIVPHQWTDTTGNYSRFGRMTGFDTQNGVVRIKTATGETYVPMSRLSPRDREYVQSQPEMPWQADPRQQSIAERKRPQYVGKPKPPIVGDAPKPVKAKAQVTPETAPTPDAGGKSAREVAAAVVRPELTGDYDADVRALHFFHLGNGMTAEEASRQAVKDVMRGSQEADRKSRADAAAAQEEARKNATVAPQRRWDGSVVTGEMHPGPNLLDPTEQDLKEMSPSELGFHQWVNEQGAGSARQGRYNPAGFERNQQAMVAKKSEWDRKQTEKDRLKRWDSNGDGFLSPEEEKTGRDAVARNAERQNLMRQYTRVGGQDALDMEFHEFEQKPEQRQNALFEAHQEKLARLDQQDARRRNDWQEMQATGRTYRQITAFRTLSNPNASPEEKLAAAAELGPEASRNYRQQVATDAWARAQGGNKPSGKPNPYNAGIDLANTYTGDEPYDVAHTNLAGTMAANGLDATAANTQATIIMQQLAFREILAGREPSPNQMPALRMPGKKKEEFRALAARHGVHDPAVADAIYDKYRLGE